MAKGIYTNKAAQTVAEFREDTVKLSSIDEEERTEKTEKSKVGKVGRPSKGQVRKISLSIPVELYDGVEFASYFFRGNITAYINSLISRDLEKNLDKYREFKKMMEEMSSTM